MSQDRITDTSTSTPAPGGLQTPDISGALSAASTVSDKIRVVHGANEMYFSNLGGKTVGTIKKSLREVMNIPSDADAVIGQKTVGDDFVLENGMNLEFVKEAGVKGSAEFFVIFIVNTLQ